MKRFTIIAIAICACAVVLVGFGNAALAYHVKFDFETTWTGDYAPGWENSDYRHGEPPVGKMMQQTTVDKNGTYGMKLIADSTPEDWMWWVGVNVTDVWSIAMEKQYDPWISVWYYDELSTEATPWAGQINTVPSWVVDEDWTDVQFGGRFNVTDNYYYVTAHKTGGPGWQDTGVARTNDWHHLKMQLSNSDNLIHFYLDGAEVGTSTRADYLDLGTTPGLYTMFLDPLSDYGDDKPYTYWDDFEFGSTYVPEPGTILMILGGLAGLAGIVRRRK